MMLSQVTQWGESCSKAGSHAASHLCLLQA